MSFKRNQLKHYIVVKPKKSTETPLQSLSSLKMLYFCTLNVKSSQIFAGLKMKSLCKSWCFKCFGGCQVGGRWGLEKEYFRPFVSFRTFLLRGTFPLCYFPPPGEFSGNFRRPGCLVSKARHPARGPHVCSIRYRGANVG